MITIKACLEAAYKARVGAAINAANDETTTNLPFVSFKSGIKCLAA